MIRGGMGVVIAVLVIGLIAGMTLAAAGRVELRFFYTRSKYLGDLDRREQLVYLAGVLDTFTYVAWWQEAAKVRVPQGDPARSIALCLQRQNLTLEQVRTIVMNWWEGSSPTLRGADVSTSVAVALVSPCR